MNIEERTIMFEQVFYPQPGEKILLLVDIPHDELHDSPSWQERRQMASEWRETFQIMGEKIGFSVSLMEYPAMGMHNAPIPTSVVEKARQHSLVLAMTTFSATSSLLPLCKTDPPFTRCASMFLVEKRMEDTAMRADYPTIKRYAETLKHLLDDAVKATIEFSTGDTLIVDLRYRSAGADNGECRRAGQFINFPSGEGFKVPYEGTLQEIDRYGPSKTEGILPVSKQGELMTFHIKNNAVVEIRGTGKKADEMRTFFKENHTRRNIAELGLGCNPLAKVTGNPLEDEKAGLHIAYGKSTHLGGAVDSDIHQDLCYAKGLPVEGTTLTLHTTHGQTVTLIQKGSLRYDIL
jgi:leucyl aminopeptidase (aminopeptidase T)